MRSTMGVDEDRESVIDQIDTENEAKTSRADLQGQERQPTGLLPCPFCGGDAGYQPPFKGTTGEAPARAFCLSSKCIRIANMPPEQWNARANSHAQLKEELLNAAKAVHSLGNHNNKDGLLPIEDCPHPSCIRRLALATKSAALPLKLTRENGSFISEVFEQVLIAANCGVSGHFRFQENGGNCTMCQRTSALEIENRRLRQEEQHFLNQQEAVARGVRSLWPWLQSELMKEVYRTIPVAAENDALVAALTFIKQFCGGRLKIGSESSRLAAKTCYEHADIALALATKEQK